MERDRLFVAIVVILLVIMLIVGVFVIKIPEPNYQILKTDDQLDYSGTIRVNDTIITAQFNASVLGADENGVSGWTFAYLAHAPIDDLNIYSFCHDLKPIFPREPLFPHDLGVVSYVGNKEISTVFGDKQVKSYLSVNGEHNESIMIDAGIDSSIVYRWTVASLNDSYNYQFIFSHFNNSAIEEIDERERDWKLEHYSVPWDQVGTRIGYSIGQHSYGIGPILIEEKETIHYILAGNGSKSYVLDHDDLVRFGETGIFSFNESLSKPCTVEVLEINSTVEPGIYWFIMVISPSNSTLHWENDDRDFGAYFIPYWKGHDEG